MTDCRLTILLIFKRNTFFQILSLLDAINKKKKNANAINFTVLAITYRYLYSRFNHSSILFSDLYFVQNNFYYKLAEPSRVAAVPKRNSMHNVGFLLKLFYKKINLFERLWIHDICCFSFWRVHDKIRRISDACAGHIQLST